MKNQYQPGFMLNLMKKDMAIAVDLGKALNVPVPLGAAAYQMYAAASRLGSGDLDFSAVAKAFEQLSGTSIA
jgi:4-hydroxybutyrate dehydrogenase/sulfolactaldehyde 3-reductase